MSGPFLPALLDDTGQLHVATLSPRATYVLGSRQDCDLVLAFPTVSRRHAEIKVRGATAFIRDLGSRNGTAVNGHVLGRREIVEAHGGATLKLGSMQGELRLLDVEAVRTRSPLVPPRRAPATMPIPYPDEPLIMRFMGFSTFSPDVDAPMGEDHGAHLDDLQASESSLDDVFEAALTHGQRDELKKIMRGELVDGLDVEPDGLETALDGIFDAAMTESQRSEVAMLVRGEKIEGYLVDTDALEAQLDERFRD